MLPILPLLLSACLGVSDSEFDALYDQDGDGHYTVENGMGDDCDDQDPDVYASAAEICDEVDNDCDGTTDEDVLLLFYADADADGHGDPLSPSEACEAPRATCPTTPIVTTPIP